MRQGVPGVVAARDLADPVTVSVICPTFDKRRHYHAAFYEIWRSQDYPWKDLWLMDDGGRPSPFFESVKEADLDVHYTHYSGRRLTVGEKRNWLVAASHGAVIAHMDDDDWYAPNYISSMVERLRATDSDLVKLSRWRHVEPNGKPILYDAEKRAVETRWGWGFSYVYRRYVATRVSFPHVDRGEDLAFIHGLFAEAMRATQIMDGAGWVEKRQRREEAR